VGQICLAVFFFKRGVAGAMLAVTHRTPWFNLRDMFQEVGKHPRPVLLIWGCRDQINPAIPVAERVKKCFSNSGLVVISNAGHVSICDQPRLVGFHTLAFLQMPLDGDIEIDCLQFGDEEAENLEAGERSQEIDLTDVSPTNSPFNIRTLMRGTIERLDESKDAEDTMTTAKEVEDTMTTANEVATGALTSIHV